MTVRNVLLVSSEVHPLAKTGGLADVAGALPKALRSDRLDIRVAMPQYGGVDADETLFDLHVPMGDHHETALIRRTALPGTDVTAYLVDNARFFHDRTLYGLPNDCERFIFFSRAVLEMLRRLDWRPEVIHCNDWQTGAIPTLVANGYPDLGRPGTLFTIHNLAYQGLCQPESLRLMGLDWDQFVPERLEFYGKLSLLKAGLLDADLINTVSLTYAKEIQTPAYGARMDGVLRTRSDRLFGVLNGIDTEVWNPANDPHLPEGYSATNLDGKSANRASLRAEVGLSASAKPLLGMISRLADQKGLDILVPLLEGGLTKKAQVVVLGTGEAKYHELLSRLAGEDLAVLLRFDEGLAHRIYAGSDAFLMPSRYEPCGLGQLIAMRYGTLPIVRRTGGLADTVTDLDEDPKAGTGFVFDAYTPEDLEDAIDRALSAFGTKAWSGAMKRGMARDFSWEASARAYMRLYEMALKVSR